MWSFILRAKFEGKVYAAHRALRADGMARLPGAPPSLRRRAAPPVKVYLPPAPPPAACVRQPRLHGRAVELRARRLEDRLARRSPWELRRWKSREPVPEIPCCLDAPHHHHHLVGPAAWAGAHSPVSSAARLSTEALPIVALHRGVLGPWRPRSETDCTARGASWRAIRVPTSSP